ncbi:hypothetical protein J5N97_008759 [Dioscorea zingiberensis]|uniref:Uncharacterized protein n=1 Tax=Dioscorea zingiberensis TaxID=325984 RepID=A0A9D5CX27_9LILI|nr:hypothetical protein J5N97_008759 [Dioscorea zingiberensis]
MPTIDFVALDRWFHRNNGSGEDSAVSAACSKTSLPSFNPALYAIPDLGSIPESSPTSDFPNPYMLNHKRREFLHPSSPCRRAVPPDHDPNEAGGASIGASAEETRSLDGKWAEEAGDQDNGEIDDFFEPRDSMSAVCSSEEEGSGSSVRRARCSARSATSEHSQYYDAEEFLSDCSISQPSPSHSTNFEVELQSLRLSLLEEIEKRKGAEEALLHMQKHWQRMATCFSQLGLSFPEVQVSGDPCFEIDPEGIFQEIIVTRFVSEAIEKSILQAETKETIEAIIESKDHEISRLRDRSQYYEAVNREMSQRNQEIAVLARQQQRKRNTIRKWIWGCIGFSITIGVSLFAQSHLLHSGNDLLHNSSSDASSGIMESDNIKPSV